MQYILLGLMVTAAVVVVVGLIMYFTQELNNYGKRKSKT